MIRSSRSNDQIVTKARDSAILYFIPFVIVAVASIGPLVWASLASIGLCGTYSRAGNTALEPYHALLESGRPAMFAQVIVRALSVGSIDAILAVLISYTLVRGMGLRLRRACLVAFTAPFLVSDATRAFGWATILGEKGWLSKCLLWAHILKHPYHGFLYTGSAPDLALIAATIPIPICVIFGALQLIPENLWKASMECGATPRTEFWRMVLPQLWTSVWLAALTGCFLTFGAGEEVSTLGGSHDISLPRIIDDLLSAGRISSVFATCSIIFLVIAAAMVGARAVQLFPLIAKAANSGSDDA